eukprot:6195531-Pleurochrysis_carterae.AAC.1
MAAACLRGSLSIIPRAMPEWKPCMTSVASAFAYASIQCVLSSQQHEQQQFTDRENCQVRQEAKIYSRKHPESSTPEVEAQKKQVIKRSGRSSSIPGWVRSPPVGKVVPHIVNPNMQPLGLLFGSRGRCQRRSSSRGDGMPPEAWDGLAAGIDREAAGGRQQQQGQPPHAHARVAAHLPMRCTRKERGSPDTRSATINESTK